MLAAIAGAARLGSACPAPCLLWPPRPVGFVRDRLGRCAGRLRRPSGRIGGGRRRLGHGSRRRGWSCRGCSVEGRRRGRRGRRVVDLLGGRGAGVGSEGGVGRLVVGEELLPCLTDGARVLPELLVHLLDQPGVGPEIRVCRGRAHESPGYRSAYPWPGPRWPSTSRFRAVRPLTTVTPWGQVPTTMGSPIEQPVDRQDPQRRRPRPQRGRQDDARRSAPRPSRGGAQGGAGRRRHDGVRHRARGGEADDVAVARRGAVRVEGLRRRDLQDQPHRHAGLRRLRR